MKNLVEVSHPVGVAKINGALGVEGSDLKVKVEVAVPLKTVVEPATEAFDKILDKMKAAIPGTWDDVIIEKFKGEYKEELVKLLSESPAPQA